MIVAVEPQCSGFEHAQFNSALLATTVLAFPEEHISFLCEASHGRHVTQALARASHPLDKLEIDHFDLRWPTNAWARLKSEEKLCSEILDLARARKATAVVFCSVTSYTLIAIKRLLASGRYHGPVIAVPHSVLLGTQRRSRRLWNRPIDIVAALRIPAPPNLRLVALSRTILDAVQSPYPANNWHHLDHPYLFYGDRLQEKKCSEPLKIGIFGALRNHLDEYVHILRSVKSRSSNVEFGLVGHLTARTTSSIELARCIPELSFQPLPASVYDELAPSFDYCLSISNPLHHKYVASNTLLDSFNHLTPVLSLGNALFEEYQTAMGDIGQSFSSADALVDAIANLSNDFPLGRYRAQTRRLRLERVRFSPAQLSEQLKALVEA
jgi:hypothetical protein